MDYFSAIILGILQGLTEFLPVSSSGHLIIARDLLGLETTNSLAVDAILQLGTILAVGLYFFKDLIRVAKNAISMSLRREVAGKDRTLVLALIFGTLPALFFGFFLEKWMDTTFRNPFLVACALIGGSILFMFAESRAKNGMGLSLKSGFFVGLFQSLALIPGVSRSGATIAGGLLLGFSREEAIRFSFLLSFPIIVVTGLKKLADLASTHVLETLGYPLLLSFLLAFFVGLASIHFLVRYLRTHTLYIFIYYRFILAAFILGFLILAR